MTQLNEAVSRYHRIIESESYQDLGWLQVLQERLREQHLTSGNHRAAPVLRPHFITQRQYANLVKAAECLHSALNRVETLALASPPLMQRMQMLPAERMLAAVDPGYSHLTVTSLLDTQIHNGTLQFVGYNADTPIGVIYGEALNNAYYDLPPVKEFRKRFPLAKMEGSKPLLDGVLRAYKDFGGKKRPNIAILEMKQGLRGSDDFAALTQLFRRRGFEAEIVSPETLEYRNGVLRSGNFSIDLVYRRIKVSEFLVRFDLNHPLVRAYKERAVCVVNSFRSEMAQKKAIFHLLTDDEVTANFPASERKAIRDFLPWTRVVAATNTTYRDEVVDLLQFIQSRRDKLVLKPNDENGDRQTFVGREMDDSAWERALKTAIRDSYVVQEANDPIVAEFPVHRYGSVELREMVIDVYPHTFLGKVSGCSTWVRPAGSAGYSTLAGMAPTFILESR
jgi:hypothetical protein